MVNQFSVFRKLHDNQTKGFEKFLDKIERKLKCKYKNDRNFLVERLL